jgi:DNA-binding beta-propeller fold protein YncE
VPTRAAAYAAKDNRKEHMLMIFDRQGRLVESWEQHNNLFQSPHSVKIDPNDPQRHVWVIDNGAHLVHKFTHDGKLVMTLGERGVRASDTSHFGGPSDIAFLPNGDFYISDGYQNSRVVKFSKDGTYLLEWGKWGKGPGEFNQPHSIAVDARRRVYVADRVNSRIQVFDEKGAFLDEWPNIRFPLHIAVSRDQFLWVADMLTHKILKYDLNGKLLYSWGTFGGQPGQLWGVHSFSTDSEGNFYVAEVYNGRAQKFRPKPGVDASKRVGPLAAR